MGGAEENAGHMGDNQSHEADDARAIHRKAHHQGGHNQVQYPPAVEIRPQGDGALIAQEHQIQGAELGEKKSVPPTAIRHMTPFPGHSAAARLPIVQRTT